MWESPRNRLPANRLGISTHYPCLALAPFVYFQFQEQFVYGIGR